MMARKLTWKGKTFGTALALLMAFTGYYEGRRLVAYQDTGGVWTICDGYTHGVKPGDTATPAQCDAYLTTELTRDLATADGMLAHKEPDYVRVAVADMVYQFGPAKVRNSTMIRRFNYGDRKGGCAELVRWVNGQWQGQLQPLPGIVRRRADARALCMRDVR